MTLTDLIFSLILIFTGITFSGAYYTKIVLRYPTLTKDQVAILYAWTTMGIGWATFGAYNIIAATAFQIT